MKRTTNATGLAKKLKIPKSRALEAILKAEMIDAIIQVVNDEELTHKFIAKRSRLPRSAVTGILSGSLQKVTLDRILRIIEAVGLTAHIKVVKAA